MQLRGRLRREVKGRARGSEGSGDELTPAHGTRLRIFDRGAPSSPQPPLVDSLSPEPSRPASLPQGRAGRVSYGSAAVAEHQPPAWVGADRNRAGCGWNDCYGPISASGSTDRKWPVSDRRTRWRSLTSLANLHLGLLGDLQRIVDLDIEIPNCAFELGVP